MGGRYASGFSTIDVEAIGGEGIEQGACLGWMEWNDTTVTWGEHARCGSLCLERISFPIVGGAELVVA